MTARARHLFVLVGFAVLPGCGGFAPEESAPLTAPATYAQWWSATESCSGLTGDFARLRFEIVPGRDFACPSGRCVGRWEPPSTIYLAREWSGNEMVVRHEMLHALIGRAGHPDPPFKRGCGLTWDSWQSDAALAHLGEERPHLE